MDITPHVNLLKSLRGDRIDYVLVVGEGIDNAFDAGANSIDIILDEGEISFQDNGEGITRGRIASVFSLGDHGPMTTTQLGRFGIGIKSQAVNAGNIFEVLSVSIDGRVKISVDWRKILKSGRWQVDDPRWMPVAIDAKRGTIITISDLRSTKAPSGGWAKKIATDAAERFYPAIAAGCRISLNGTTIEVLPEPQITDVIECQLPLSDGRSAHLRAGMLASQSSLNRVHVAYRHRVIMPSCSLGCGDYGGLTKMFARIQLSGAWHLAKFKNDLTDEDEREELDAAVEQAIRPILEKCSSASISAKVNEIAHLLNELVPRALAARPKHRKPRNPNPNPGPKPKRPPGEVNPENSDPLGPAKSKRPPQDQLLITFDGIAEQHGIGEFAPGRPHRVNLSKDHPYIARLIEHRDQQIIVQSLLALAFALFEQGRDDLPEPDLPLDTFGKRIARLLSLQTGETEQLKRMSI